jgi:hypothetical protein
MTKELFNLVLQDHIGAWLQEHGLPGPKIILIDGDGSHEPHLLTILWLLDHNIELFRLPPNLTHLLCPLDVNVFVHLKHGYRELMRRAMHDGTVLIGVAARWRLMDTALTLISPRIVIEGWRKASLYPLDEDMWKREKWAETSMPFARPPEQRQARCSLRLQLKTLADDLMDSALPADQKLDRVRSCARAHPNDDDIVQAALPRPHAQPGTRRRGRLAHPEAKWLTGDEARQITEEKEAKAAAERQRALHRATRKKTIERIKQLVQAAEEAYARATSSDRHGAEPSRGIDEAQAAKQLATEAVRTQETQGAGKTHAMKAKRIIKGADRYIHAFMPRCGSGPPADAAHVTSANISTVAAADKENRPPTTTTVTGDTDCARPRQGSTASVASKGTRPPSAVPMLRA